MTDSLTVVRCEDQSEWDRLVGECVKANVFASWFWGEYKSRLGWKAERVTVRDKSDKILAVIQYQVKVVLFARQVLMQGCPLLTASGESSSEDVIGAFLGYLSLKPFDLVFVSFENFESSNSQINLLRNRFAPFQSRKFYTIDVDLTQNLNDIRAALLPKWRKPLQKAERNPDLRARFVVDEDERLVVFDRFWEMYRRLKTRKGFSDNFDGTLFRDLLARDPNYRMLEIRENDEVVLIRIAHVSKARFTDFYAASTDRANACAAPTLSVWRFIEQAHAEGKKVFDMGGVDPLGNAGVFEFKRGVSKNIVSTGPRWVYGRNKVIKTFAAAVLAIA